MTFFTKFYFLNTKNKLSRTYEEDPEEAMRQSLLLMDEGDLETGIRSGDIYGFMIEHYASVSNFQKVGT